MNAHSNGNRNVVIETHNLTKYFGTLRGVGLSKRQKVRVRFATSPAMDGFDGPSGTARILSDDCSRGMAGHGALPCVRTPPHCDKRTV